MPEFRLVIDNAVERRQRRLNLDVPVCLIVKRPDKVLLLNARFRDISEDGAAIFAGLELGIDTEIQVEFTAPFDCGPLRVRAIVRNRRGYVYGLEFLPRDAEEEQTLKTLKTMLLPIGKEAKGSVEDRRWT